jgi:hypothetical protein
MTIMDDIANLELFVPFFVPAVARVTVEGGGPVPRFQLRFSRITGSRFEVRIVNTPLFEEKLRPGDYRVTFTDLLTSYRLTALTANGRDLLTHPYTVTPAGAPEIEARLAAAASPPPWRKVSGKFAGRALADRTSVKVWNELSAGPLDMTFYLDGSFEMLALPGKTRVVAMNPDLGEFVTTEFTVPPSDLDHVTIDLPAALRSPSRVTGHIEGRARAASGARELVLRAEGSAETKELRTPLYMDGTFEFSSIQPGAYLAEIDGGKPVKVIVSPGADDIVVRVDGNQ